MSGRSAAKPAPAGTGRLSTMMVMMMAMTPSVKAFRRSGFMHLPRGSRALLVGRSRSSRGVVVNLGLCLHPLDQLIELDRLLGRGQCVLGRKSSLTGGLSSPAGGSGY